MNRLLEIDPECPEYSDDVHQDERPDLGHKAMLSITVSSYDQEGDRAWNASQMSAARTRNPIGDPADGIEAAELLKLMLDELGDRLLKVLG